MINTKETMLSVLKLLAYLICVLIIVLGHKQIGLLGTSIQLVGLTGILLIIWDYNRKFKS